MRNSVKWGLHPLCNSLGLPRIRVHDLRHLSLLAEAGVPVKDLQRRAGHATPAMTLRYTHSLDDTDSRAAEALEKVAEQPG